MTNALRVSFPSQVPVVYPQCLLFKVRSARAVRGKRVPATYCQPTPLQKHAVVGCLDQTFATNACTCFFHCEASRCKRNFVELCTTTSVIARRQPLKSARASMLHPLVVYESAFAMFDASGTASIAAVQNHMKFSLLCRSCMPVR